MAVQVQINRRRVEAGGGGAGHHAAAISCEVARAVRPEQLVGLWSHGADAFQTSVRDVHIQTAVRIEVGHAGVGSGAAAGDGGGDGDAGRGEAPRTISNKQLAEYQARSKWVTAGVPSKKVRT